jgi:aspartate/methionine/tyrosine aminotransferase
MNSTALVTKLREEQGVLIVPGDHFGMDGYLRIGFGSQVAELEAGLSRLQRVLEA